MTPEALEGEGAIVREAIVLAGGEATRLGELAAAVPKCLQPVAGRPFLDHLLVELRRYGVRRVVLATGRLHEAVEAHVGNGAKFGLEVVYSLEPEPLGTGGAVALASAQLAAPFAYVCNGDSLLDCNLHALSRALRESPGAEASVALRAMADTGRFGRVELAGDGRVTSFVEKGSAGPGLINGGVYCVRTASLRALPRGRSSLELDVLAPLASAGSLVGIACDGFFLDIGLPDALGEAQQALPQWLRRPCAFLDRDGVINEDRGHVHSADEFVFMPGMPDAIRELNDAGWLVIVITNQAGIGRGLYAEDDFATFTRWIDERLAESGAHVDATYYCPHHPTEAVRPYLTECDCRKPAPGMLTRALEEWNVDVARSFMLGDKESDMAAAAGAGIRGVLYRGGDLREIVRRLMAEAPAASERTDRPSDGEGR